MLSTQQLLYNVLEGKMYFESMDLWFLKFDFEDWVSAKVLGHEYVGVQRRLTS